MHVHFIVCLFDNYKVKVQTKDILGDMITSTLNCLVVFINWTWERHFMEITIQSMKQNHNLLISSNKIRCSLLSGQEYTEAKWNVYAFICLVCLFD